jgi:hypothetical protein
MRLLAAIALWCIGIAAYAERVVLIPLDNRPAAGQFAQMIGAMADVQVVMPPYETLGRFIQPGDPDAILAWLEQLDYKDISAVVVNSDMLCYGGLIASRTNDTPVEIAFGRLKRLGVLRKKVPKTRFYVFSSIMRLAPTATRATAAWRLQLARYAELKDQLRREPNPELQKRLDALAARIPGYEIIKYEDARNRNIEVSRELIKMRARSQFDYLIFGQDDAKPFGPHIPETERLRKLAANQYVAGSTFFCEGIDQLGNISLSRALLKQANWTPRLRIVYSDNTKVARIANYESKQIQTSVKDQVLSSGARIAVGDEDFDYTLYVNVPGRDPGPFAQFQQALTSEVEQGFPVAVADINIANDGTSDAELFATLQEGDRMFKLLSFAGWNTAGNSLGTAIPTANIYLLARRLKVDPLKREIAQREFLLHRFVNDYAYHKITRPQAYALIDANARASREETYGLAFEEVNEFVASDLKLHLDKYFAEDFMGKRFFAGTQQYEVTGLSEVKIFLPWPRAYEVRLEFKLQTSPVTPPPSGD